MDTADADVPLLSLPTHTHTDTDTVPLAGVSDFRGRPVYRRDSGGWRSALFVVVVEIAGSFAFFGVSANLITYLTGPLGQSNAAAAAAVNAWSGTASLLPLLGAFVADSCLGRYRSIVLAFTLYVLGYGMLTLASTLPTCTDDSSCRPSWPQVAFFYGSLYLIALAQGADKPCGLAFGADQFDPDHPRECASRSSLFNWWYFSMAVGIAVAVAVVSYVQENVGWGVGFGAPAAIMLCAFAVFLLGTPTYRLYAPSPGAESPLARLARSLAALAKRRHHLPSLGSLQEEEEAAAAAKSEEARGVLRLLPIWATCLAFPIPTPTPAVPSHTETSLGFAMENDDETLASPAEKTALNGGVAEEEVTVTAAAHPAKSYAAVAASAEIEDLRAAKLDLEEKLAAADRENKALASEAHRLEGLFSQARDDVATAEHAASTSEGEVASLRAEVERLRNLLKAEKGEREADKRNSELLAAEVEAVRQVKLKLEKEIEALKASAAAAVTAEERKAAPAAEAPKEAEVAWQGMAAAAAAGAGATAAFVLVYLRLKR